MTKLLNPITAQPLSPERLKPDIRICNAINMLIAQNELNDYNARLIEALINSITFSEKQNEQVIELGLKLAQEQFEWTNQNAEWQELGDSPDNPQNWQ